MNTTCRNCGKYLGWVATSRRKFCNDKCRVSYHRKASAQSLYGQAIVPITKFSKVASGERKRAIESLKVLRKAIDDQLRVLGDVETQDKFEMLQAWKNR